MSAVFAAILILCESKGQGNCRKSRDGPLGLFRQQPVELMSRLSKIFRFTMKGQLYIYKSM